VKKIFNKIFRSEFNKNVLILSSGTAISQFILVLISPVLTRLYTPEAFGAFAVFLSITAIIGSNINLKYEQAIMLPKEESDAYKIAYLANYLNFIISLIIFICIVIFFDPIANALNIESSKPIWLYFIPLATYFIGFNTVLINLNNRFKNYKSMSGSVVIKNFSMTIVQLLFGFLKLLLDSGLIIGQFVAYILGNRVLRLNVSFKYKEMISYKYKDLKTVLHRYRDFPRYAFPAGLANATTLNISNLLITSIYSVNDVGQFSLANRIIGAPNVLIAQSVSQVYYQKACEEIKIRGNCKSIFLSTLKKLIVLVVPIYIPLIFVSKWIFPFIFGLDWVDAGVFAGFLAILMAVRFVSSTLSVTINAVEKQKIGLITNIILLFINLATFGTAYFLKLNILNFIILYSLSLTVAYAIFLIIYYKIAFCTRQ
jgi:O-antigen/teichoic acid export membrane protein